MSSSRILLSRRALLAGAASSLGAGNFSPRGTFAQAQPVLNYPSPWRDPSQYTAYIPCASKTGPFYIYTCEFDASWAILKTFGIDATLDDQLQLMPFDYRLEPYYEWTDNGVFIYGGDITSAYSGDYTSNFLCRTTGPVMRKVFQHYGLYTKIIKTEQRIKRHLDRGRMIWIKITVDFKDWTPATWITPEGKQLQVVLSNDHAMVVIGYNDEVVVVRDLLGPTDTNWERGYEVEVPWDRFMACWGAQGNDGVAVGPPDS
jgi:hypothetical protein